MNAARFKSSLASPAPPDGLPPALEALWWEAKGDWKKAHEIAQEHDTREASWVHAYLHRVEGDLSNAGYWYRQAKRPAATAPLKAEWEAIVTALLESA